MGVVDEGHVGLDVRLDNRHLDLRRAHVNAMFQLRGKVLQYGREHLITEGFNEMNSPKIIAIIIAFPVNTLSGILAAVTALAAI